MESKKSLLIQTIKEKFVMKQACSFDYRKQAISAAKDLRYGDEVVKAIKKAKTHGEIQRIMVGARHEKIEKDYQSELMARRRS